MTTRVNGCQVVPSAAARAGQDRLSRLPKVLLHKIMSFFSGTQPEDQVCGMHFMSRICKTIGASLSERQKKLTSFVMQSMSEWENKGVIAEIVKSGGWLNELRVYFAHKPSALCTRDENGRTILHTACLKREEPLPVSFVKSILALDCKHRLGLTAMADHNGKKLEKQSLLAYCWRVLSFSPKNGAAACLSFLGLAFIMGGVVLAVLADLRRNRFIELGLRERLKTFRQADTRADTERLLEYLRSHRFRIKRFAFCGVGSLLGLLGCTGYYYNELLVKPYNAKVNGAYGPLADRIPKLQEEVTKDIKGKKA